MTPTHGDMICEDCLLPLRECKCENWHGTDGDDEDDVYSYAPQGAVAYDVNTPEGAAAAHRADMIAFPYCNAYEY